MKNLILIIITVVALASCKKECNNKSIEIYNPTPNAMWVIVDSNVVNTISPYTSEVVLFNKCNTNCNVVFNSIGYNIIQDEVYIDCCNTTFFIPDFN